MPFDSPDATDSFSANYAEARERFIAAATAAGGALERLAHPESGPGGEALSTDLAWFGPADAGHVLVLLSGTHGVEGYCGSGAQVEWLRRGEAARLPADTAVLLVHAVNPYGFAWDRRVTEDNVDLNRNWVDFDRALPANPGYAELHPIVCPAEWTELTQRQSVEALRNWTAEHGAPAMQAAVTGGQYTHATGLFYGGAAPTWSRRTQTAILQSRLRAARRVAIIDFHTGLGPWGFGEQIVPVPREGAAFARAARWFGAGITSPAGGTSTSADISGDGLSAAAALLPHAEVTVMALEFGTVPTKHVLDALRADAWLHAHGEPLSPQGAEIRAQVRGAFYGDRADWKGMVAGQSMLAIRQALSGLQLAPLAG